MSGRGGSAHADRLDISATASADECNKALTVAQQHVPAVSVHSGHTAVPAQTVHSNIGDPRMPHQWASPILGLTDYSSKITHIANRATAGKQSTPNAADPSDCNLPQDFAKRDGLSGLYAKGARGGGTTLGIVTLAALDPGAPEYFWHNVAHIATGNRTGKVKNIDGGPGAPSDASGTGETHLDVEQSGGAAPDANVVVYQAPNTDPGFADAFFAAASNNVATVSPSWGESETVIRAAVASGEETPAYQAVFDEAFLEFGAQRQSAFAASGDAAEYDDNDELGTTSLVVDSPANSPYISAAGGTTLPMSLTITGTAATTVATVKAERAWGWDYLWAPVATANATPLDATAEGLVVGGGGGISGFEAKPAHQYGVSGTSSFDAVPYLTPTDPQDVGGITEPTAWAFNPTPKVVTGTGSGRALPDLSADADPETGYLVYEPSAVAAGAPAIESFGGTSFTSPQFNGSTADVVSAVGHRVGFLNPSLYRLAGNGSGALTPLQTPGTSNDNIYYTGKPGALFNPATGLGLPNFTKVAACPH